MTLFIPPSKDHPVRMVFNSNPAPRKVIAHLVNFPPGPDNEEFWTVRLYRNDFDKFSAEDKLVIFNWVSDIIRMIRMIEPNCFLEVYEEAPNEQQQNGLYSR